MEFLLGKQVSQRRVAALRRSYVSLPRTKQSFKPSTILSLWVMNLQINNQNVFKCGGSPKQSDSAPQFHIQCAWCRVWFQITGHGVGPGDVWGLRCWCGPAEQGLLFSAHYPCLGSASGRSCALGLCEGQQPLWLSGIFYKVTWSCWGLRHS